MGEIWPKMLAGFSSSPLAPPLLTTVCAQPRTATAATAAATAAGVAAAAAAARARRLRQRLLLLLLLGALTTP